MDKVDPRELQGDEQEKKRMLLILNSRMAQARKGFSSRHGKTMKTSSITAKEEAAHREEASRQEVSEMPMTIKAKDKPARN